MIYCAPWRLLEDKAFANYPQKLDECLHATSVYIKSWVGILAHLEHNFFTDAFLFNQRLSHTNSLCIVDQIQEMQNNSYVIEQYMQNIIIWS